MDIFRKLAGRVFLLLAIFLARPAAAEMTFMQFIPSALQAVLQPQQTYSARLVVQNPSADAMDLQVEPEYWHPGTTTERVSDWLCVSPAQIHLAGHGRQEVTISLPRLPAGLQGECVVMLYFAQAAVSSSISIRPRVGIPLYVLDPSREMLKGEIVAFRAESGASAADGPAFVVRARNTGNVHLVPLGVIELKNQDTGRKYRETLKFREPILTGQELEMRVKFSPRAVPAGEYQAEVSLVLDTLYGAQAPEGNLNMVTASTAVTLR